MADANGKVRIKREKCHKAKEGKELQTGKAQLTKDRNKEGGV